MKNLQNLYRSSLSFLKESLHTTQSAVLLFLLLQISTINLFAQGPPYLPGTAPACMKTNTLNIHTGMNWQANALYGIGNQDNYWHMTSNNNGPAPMCALAYQTGCGNVIAGTMPISVVATGDCLDNMNLAGNLKNNSVFYTFERSIWVDAPTTSIFPCTLTLDIIQDDKLHDVLLVNSAGTVSLGINTGINASCNLNSGGNFFVSLRGGENRLQFEILSRKFTLGPPADQSPMYVDVAGTFTYTGPGGPIFIRNDYFIPNAGPVWGCGVPGFTPFPPLPTYSYTCLELPNTTGQLHIGNYNPSFTYAITPAAPISPTGIITTQSGTTYTVSVSDAFGCFVTNTAQLTAAPPLTYSLTPNQACIVPGTNVTLFSNVQGGTPGYIYGNPASNPSGNVYLNTPGIYTIAVLDMHGCTATAIATIGNRFDIALSSNSPCVGQNITVTPTPNLTGLTYVMNGPINQGPQTSNVFSNISAAGTYTITATDQYGCTATSTTTIFQNPVLYVTSNNVLCYPTFTVHDVNNVPIVGSGWADPYNTVAWTTTPPSANHTPQAQFPIPPPLTYTVTAFDANGCSATTTQYYEANPFCCNLTSMTSPTSHLFSTLPAYNNSTTTDLLNDFGNPPGNVITTNDYIVIDDVDFVVDQDITFLNCPNLRFTFNTRLRVMPNVTLTLDNSVLRANCEYMWNGIVAYDPSCQINIVNSTLQDMNEGVFLKAGAKLDCQGSTFMSNYRSIQFVQAPLGYNSTSGSCIVRNNYFGSTGFNLFYPYANLTKGEFGIHVNECREVEIGQLFSNNQVQATNKFEDLYCGILIGSGSMLNTETYNLYNNEFINIKSNPASEQWKLGNFVSTSHGAGIYVRPIFTTPLTSNHVLNVKGQGDFVAFNECDKAIAGRIVSANIEYQVATNCLMGFMFADDKTQKYDIHHNAIGTPMVGMQFVGDAGGAQIHHNSIGSPWLMANPNIYPLGINVNFASNSHAAPFKIYENDIQLLAQAGAGINLLNTGSGTELLKNNIYLGAQNPANITAPTIPSGGISANNCKGTAFRGNHLDGTIALLGPNANALDGMELIKSPSCILECNHFSYTRKGLRVEGDCSTGPLDVKGNTFYMHGRGMWFDDMPLELGGLSDVGNLTTDNFNTFSNSALSGGGYGIWRNSSSSYPGTIFTTQFLQAFSGGASLPAPYNVSQNNGATLLECQPPFALMAMQNSIAEGMSIADALAIVYDSTSSNTNFEEVAIWMREQGLVEQLEHDSAMLQTNIDLQNFYAQQMQTTTKELRLVEQNLLHLNDSLLSTDSVAWYTLLANTDSINNTITSSIEVVQNMAMTNRYYIKWLAGGIDSLSQSEKDSVKYIADLCPFVGGLAVYRARMLYNNIEPMAWADRVICNALVMNKNGDSGDDLSIDESLLKIIDQEVLKLYPNPASSTLTLEYNLQTLDKGHLVFYDLLGREQLTVQLSSYANKVSFSIKTLPKGLYLCKYVVNGIGKQVVKVIIE